MAEVASHAAVAAVALAAIAEVVAAAADLLPEAAAAALSARTRRLPAQKCRLMINKNENCLEITS